MGERRDALIKDIGKKDSDWKNYAGAQDTRKAYELAEKTNKALNLYDKRLKDSGYRAKLKALKNAVRTIQAIVDDLENARSVVKSAVDETISYIRKAEGSKTLLERDYFKPDKDAYVFDKVPEISSGKISWEELKKLTEKERKKANQRSNSFNLISDLVESFRTEKNKWDKEEDKKLSKEKRKENKNKKKERRLKSKKERELERKLFKLEELFKKTKTKKELENLKKELEKLSKKLGASKASLEQDKIDKFNTRIGELNKKLEEKLKEEKSKKEE